jgi:hypothetical protein
VQYFEKAMSEQRTTPNRRIARAMWWTAAAIVVCVVAILVWGGLYAGRRVLALRQMVRDPEIRVDIQPPWYVPTSLQSRVPKWANEFRGIKIHDREDWNILSAFPELEQVESQYAGLIDTDLRQLRSLRHLETLDLWQEPGITDAGIACLEGMPHLSKVIVFGSQIGDAGLRSIARIPNLQVLSIELTHGTGEGFSALHEARQLRSVMIGVEAGSGISLEALESVDSLEELGIYGSGIAEAMRSLRLPPHLRNLDVGSDLNDAQVDNIPELLAAVPGIDRVQELDFHDCLLSSVTIAQICERLGRIEQSGIFRRSSP